VYASPIQPLGTPKPSAIRSSRATDCTCRAGDDLQYLRLPLPSGTRENDLTDASVTQNTKYFRNIASEERSPCSRASEQVNQCFHGSFQIGVKGAVPHDEGSHEV